MGFLLQFLHNDSTQQQHWSKIKPGKNPTQNENENNNNNNNMM